MLVNLSSPPEKKINGIYPGRHRVNETHILIYFVWSRWGSVGRPFPTNAWWNQLGKGSRVMPTGSIPGFLIIKPPNEICRIFIS